MPFKLRIYYGNISFRSCAVLTGPSVLKRAALCVKQREETVGESYTQCQGSINTTNTTLPLHPLCVWTRPPSQGNTAHRANRHRTNTCTQTLVCVQRRCLKTFSLAKWWERSGRRELKLHGNAVQWSKSTKDKQAAVFHYSKRWVCLETARSVGSRTQTDL